jgi:multiple sugar transport system substrate-binding protein
MRSFLSYLPAARRGLLALSLVILAACQQSNAAQPLPTLPARSSNQPVELVIWAEWNTQDSMVTDPEGAGRYGLFLKNQFEREHPGVTVRLEYQGWDEALRQNLFNALLAGTPPDIVVGENYFRFFAELGALVPLDDVLGPIKDDLIPATYRAVEYEGHVYGVPAFTGVFGFERNCTVIEAAGLDCDTPPATWDDLLDQARAITEAGAGTTYGYGLQGPAGTSTGSVFRIAAFLAQADAALCRDDACTEPYFDNPKAAPVLKFVRELNRFTPPGLTFNPHEGQVYGALYQDLTAYQIAGSWHPVWAQASGCTDCRYSAIPIPTGGHPASLVVGNTIYAVLSQSQHPELAAEWVRFLARDDVQDLVYPALGRLPTTRSALERLRAEVTPEMAFFVDELLTNPSLQILPQWSQEPQVFWQIYNDLLTGVLTTERPVQDLMTEAQAEADRVLAP